MIDPDTPDRESPIAVADVVHIGGTLAMSNDVGGTELLKDMEIEVEVIKAFWDYECGWRYHGRVLDDAVVADLRTKGTSGYDAEYYRRKYPNNPDLAEGAAKARAVFDPSKVYFSEFDLRDRPTPRI